jgi:hypothetical protein
MGKEAEGRTIEDIDAGRWCLQQIKHREESNGDLKKVVYLIVLISKYYFSQNTAYKRCIGVKNHRSGFDHLS